MRILDSVKKGFAVTHESLTLLIGLFLFNLVVGKGIPLELKQGCYIRSTEGYIAVADDVDENAL